MGGVGKSLFGSVGGFGDKLFKETANVVTLGASNKVMEKLTPEVDTTTPTPIQLDTSKDIVHTDKNWNKKKTASNTGIQI